MVDRGSGGSVAWSHDAGLVAVSAPRHHLQHHAAGIVSDREMLAAVDRHPFTVANWSVTVEAVRMVNVCPTVGVKPVPKLMFSVPPSVAP